MRRVLVVWVELAERGDRRRRVEEFVRGPQEGSRPAAMPRAQELWVAQRSSLEEVAERRRARVEPQRTPRTTRSIRGPRGRRSTCATRLGTTTKFASVLLHAIHRAALPLETASGVLGCGYDSSCHTGSVEPGARAAAVSHGRPVWSTWIDARRGRGCVGIVVGENPDGAAWQIDEAPVNARDPLQTTVGARLMPDPPV